MTIAATVTTQVDHASVLGLTAVTRDPTKIAPTAAVHTNEIPRVALRKAALSHTSGGADSFPYSAAKFRPTMIVPAINTSSAPFATGTNHLLDQLSGASRAITNRTAMMAKVPQSKDLGWSPDAYSHAMSTTHVASATPAANRMWLCPPMIQIAIQGANDKRALLDRPVPCGTVELYSAM